MYNGEYEYYDDSMGWPAFFIGVLLGGGGALLLAPQTGNQLRSLLRNYAAKTKGEVLEQGKSAWDTAVDKGKEYYDKGHDGVQGKGRSAREFKETAKERLREAS
ncbi:MAG: YtxH domain-containing protein [Nitrospirae bacterium]|nr:YtxH domain-containing protein [Nitrospirota bacterium]